MLPPAVEAMIHEAQLGGRSDAEIIAAVERTHGVSLMPTDIPARDERAIALARLDEGPYEIILAGPLKSYSARRLIHEHRHDQHQCAFALQFDGAMFVPVAQLHVLSLRPELA